ncbi:HNH endonuclease [Burkholderia multivorans]|nr:HNH endonuclease [Burkholderia multivorans]
MAIIRTAKGEEILIDDSDYELVSRWTWRTIGRGYAARSVYDPSKPSKRTNQYLHRLLLGLSDGDGAFVDHVNGNRLDNRRSNLRLCTVQENGRNSKVRSHNKSGFKGVFWDRRREKWTAYIKVDGKQRYLGLFSTAQLAHEAYCAAARKHFGAFAREG